MARYSGGPTVHRAIKGPPRLTGVSRSSPQGWKAEVVTTLRAIQEVRQACDNTEVRTVRYARKAGLSWAEIATALGGYPAKRYGNDGTSLTRPCPRTMLGGDLLP